MGSWKSPSVPAFNSLVNGPWGAGSLGRGPGIDLGHPGFLGMGIGHTCALREEVIY